MKQLARRAFGPCSLDLQLDHEGINNPKPGFILQMGVVAASARTCKLAGGRI